MNRVQRFLPLLLALSTSSPFWRGEPTGLKSYRFASNGQSPRSGLPGWFASANEFDRYVAKLVAAKFIPDASYLWWAIRPSSRFPTLELRIADSCTRVRDAAAVAALYQSLLHYLAHNPASSREWEHHHLLINQENLWQAVRHGTDARFVDPVNRRDQNGRLLGSRTDQPRLGKRPAARLPAGATVGRRNPFGRQQRGLPVARIRGCHR